LPRSRAGERVVRHRPKPEAGKLWASRRATSAETHSVLVLAVLTWLRSS